MAMSMFANGAFFNSYLSFSINEAAPTNYYLWSGSPAVHNANLGTVEHLTISGALIEFRREGANQTGGEMGYQIKNAGGTIVVSATNIPFSNFTYTGGNNYTASLPTIDLLAGLAPNASYKFECWFHQWGSEDIWGNAPGGGNFVVNFTIADIEPPVVHLSGISKVFLFQDSTSSPNWYQGGTASPYGGLPLIQGHTFDITIGDALNLGIEIATTPATAVEGNIARMGYTIDGGEAQYIYATYVEVDNGAAKWQSNSTQITNIANGLGEGNYALEFWYEAIEPDVDTFYYSYQPSINYSLTLNIDDGIVPPTPIDNIAEVYVFNGDSYDAVDAAWYKTHGEADLPAIGGHTFNVAGGSPLNIGAKVGIAPVTVDNAVVEMSYFYTPEGEDAPDIHSIPLTYLGVDEINSTLAKYASTDTDVKDIAAGLADGTYTLNFWFRALIPDVDTNYYHADMSGANFVATVIVGEMVTPYNPIPALEYISKAFMFVDKDENGQDWYKGLGIESDLPAINGASFEVNIYSALNMGGELWTYPTLCPDVVARMGYMITQATGKAFGEAAYIPMTYVKDENGASQWQTSVSQIANIADGLETGEYTVEIWFEAYQSNESEIKNNVYFPGSGINEICTLIVTNPSSSFGLSGDKIVILSGNNSINAYFTGKADVMLYSVSGQLISKRNVNETYSAQVHSGIYFLVINGKAHKVVVK
ncbi:hypothetical protein FACS1894178_8210 [Bacteroidia bacterium]|nr:hypothetical protein FACS1894178_8210 [Bacteroidia bacterium]